ncbi:MAG: S-layer homology domain-containing protein [Candidatus Gracilibacteria bacterium]
MKKHLIFASLLFSVFLSTPFAKADVIPENSQAIDYCEKIINVNEFTGSGTKFVLLGVTRSMSETDILDVQVIKDNECISKYGYKFNPFSIYITQKGTFDSLNIKEPDTISFDDRQKFIPLSITPVSYTGYSTEPKSFTSVITSYKIVEFKDESLQIVKIFEVEVNEIHDLMDSITPSDNIYSNGYAFKLSQDMKLSNQRSSCALMNKNGDFIVGNLSIDKVCGDMVMNGDLFQASFRANTTALSGTKNPVDIQIFDYAPLLKREAVWKNNSETVSHVTNALRFFNGEKELTETNLQAHPVKVLRAENPYTQINGAFYLLPHKINTGNTAVDAFGWYYNKLTQEGNAIGYQIVFYIKEKNLIGYIDTPLQYNFQWNTIGNVVRAAPTEFGAFLENKKLTINSSGTSNWYALHDVRLEMNDSRTMDILKEYVGILTQNAGIKTRVEQLQAIPGTIRSITSFPDVTQENMYYQSINDLKERDILSGYSDGSFKPFSSLNRAEFLKIIVSASKENQNGVESCLSDKKQRGWSYVYFPDVNINAWYAKYVCSAVEEEIIKGYSDGLFHGEKTIILPEALKISLLSFHIQAIEYSSGAWYQVYLDKGEQYGLFNADYTKNDVSASVRRGYMAELTYRLIKETQAIIFID